jgi:hypothetical protein
MFSFEQRLSQLQPDFSLQISYNIPPIPQLQLVQQSQELINVGSEQGGKAQVTVTYHV